MEIVKMNNVTKKFAKNIAVNQLSLTIKKGQIFGLLGPNGAGKSTVINMLSGLIQKTSGEIKVFGELQTNGGKGQAIKQKIGLVPQELALYNTFSALENVKFFAGLYGFRGAELDKKAKEAIEFVGLTEKAKERPDTFSGGMKRRLNIACAIAHSPELIIMDEPTVGIDPQSRKYILSSIKKLNERGSTIIYTSHYMEEVEEICDYIAIIDQGQVIAEGSENQLINLVTDVKSFNIIISGEVAAALSEVKQIPGVKSVEWDNINHLKVISKSEVNNLNQILAILLSHQIEILEIDQQNLNLETVFLTLTGRKLRD